jgi:hypothetical protein
MKKVLARFMGMSVALGVAITLLTLPGTAQTKGERNCGPTVNESLTNYLRLNEVTPTQIINNTEDPGLWMSVSEMIKIGDHSIEWVTDVTKTASESYVKINGQIISFKGLVSVNEADEDSKITGEMIDQWDQLTLYKLGEQEIIGITAGPRSCTGRMCGVGAQLIYDTKTKKATFFGTFRTYEKVKLFRFKGDKPVYYFLAKRFDGDPHDNDKASVTYFPYLLKPDGELVLQRNKRKQPYFIKHTYYPNQFDSRTRKSKPALKADILEQDWIEKIDF